MSVALRTEGVTRRFGGFTAVDRVSMSVPAGEIHAVIGPNGAGKSTLFSLIAGGLRCSEGRIVFFDEDVTRLRSYQVARKGVGRVFQLGGAFPTLSALEAVGVAVALREHRSWQLLRRMAPAHMAEAASLLRTVGLGGVVHQRSGLLSHGDQRALELAVALARRPRILLLDEPTAGMGRKETNELVEMIRRLARERDLTVLLVEHDIDATFGLADRITVLLDGSVLCTGTPEEVARDQRVVDAYLGEEA